MLQSSFIHFIYNSFYIWQLLSLAIPRLHLTFILCKISHTYTLRVGCAKNRTLSIRPNAADVYQTIIFLVSTQDSNLVCCFRELAN